MAGFVSTQTFISGSSSVVARKIDFHTCLLSFKNSNRGLNWVQSCITFKWSQHHITISRVHPWGSFWEQERQAEYIFQGQRRGEEHLIVGFSSWVTQAHVLLMSFPSTSEILMSLNDKYKRAMPENAWSFRKGGILLLICWNIVFLIPELLVKLLMPRTLALLHLFASLLASLIISS